MKVYVNYWDTVNHYMNLYNKKWWDYVAKQGSLIDNICFYWDKLKYTVILEKYLDSNLSWFTITHYNKLPQKYEKYFFEYDD
jgi:hypothetical protein